MTNQEAKSCIGTIEMLQRLAYNIHGVMDVIDADNCKKIIKVLDQEPRKITYEDVKGYCKPRCLTIIDNELLYELTHPKIKALEQEPKTGHWKRISMDKYSEHAKYWYRCDRCGKDNLGNTDWCPNCGAKMVEPQESEDKE